MTRLNHKFFFLFLILTLAFSINREASAQWVQTTLGVGSGYSPSCLALIGAHIFAGISGNGIYRSDDSGITLHNVYTTLWSLYVNGFTQINTTLFASTGVKLLRTSDLGEHWDSSCCPGGWPITTMGSDLISGSNQGFFFSTDEGVSWINRGAGLDYGQLICLLSKDSNLFAGTGFGDCGTVFESTDSGMSWNTLNLGSGCTDVYSLAKSANFIFCGTGSGSEEKGSGIFRRTTIDTTWTAINNGLRDMTETEIVTIEASNENVFFGSNSLGVFYSSDYGGTWDSINEGLTTWAIQQLLIAPPFIFAGTDSGVWRRPLSDFSQSGVAESTTATSATSLHVFPNPASNDLQIMGGQSGEVHLFDLMGREVLTPAPLPTGRGVFDVSHLEAGMYFLRSGSESAKVEIAH